MLPRDRLPAQRRLQTRHQQRGGDALPGYIADRDTERSVGKGHKIVVVATDTQRGTAVARVVETGDEWEDLGEEPLLHFAGDLQLAVEPLAPCNLPRDAGVQPPSLHRQPAP